MCMLKPHLLDTPIVLPYLQYQALKVFWYSEVTELYYPVVHLELEYSKTDYSPRIDKILCYKPFLTEQTLIPFQPDTKYTNTCDCTDKGLWGNNPDLRQVVGFHVYLYDRKLWPGRHLMDYGYTLVESYMENWGWWKRDKLEQFYSYKLKFIPVVKEVLGTVIVMDKESDQAIIQDMTIIE